MSSETITPPKYAPNLYNPPESAVRESDAWAVDAFHPDVFYSYDSRFGPLLELLGCSSFLEVIDMLKAKGDVHILDLMGGAYFLRPDQYQSVTSVTGMRLGNPEANIIEDLQKGIELEQNRFGDRLTEHCRRLLRELADIELLNREEKRKVVYGSVYDKSSWRLLSQSMREREIDSFGLVICRPEGPFYQQYITNHRPMSDRQKLRYGLVFDKTFREVLARVDKKNGVLFFQIPKIFNKRWVLAWVKRIESKYGLKVTVAQDEEFDDIFQESFSYMFLARYTE